MTAKPYHNRLKGVCIAPGGRRMTAELWLHRPCVHGHEGSFQTHPPVAEMLKGDELPCEGGQPPVRLDPDKVVFTIPNDMWGCDDEYTVQDVIDELEKE